MTSTHERAVVVGGGHAAGQLCASLRAGGWQGAITVVGDEPAPPYQRPPLSKAYLAGTLEEDRLYVRPREFYEEAGIALRLGQRAEAIDLANARVATTGGDVPYDRLVLATGTRPRRLSCEGAGLSGIGYVRTLADVDALRADFAGAQRLVVVGAGYIGLEVAAVARTRGLDVTVVEAQPRVLARVTGSEVSAYYEALHESRGVIVRLGTGVEGFEGQGGRVTGVALTDGTSVPADLVVVGIGVVPNQEVAARAGLACSNGIVVDDHCRTSAPHVLAVGDVTEHPSVYGRTVRLESVHNALEQAKTAAATLCGKPTPYAQVPWFWSDQYAVKLQTVGLLEGHDAVVVRGCPDPGEGAPGFCVFYLQGGRLLAADAVNDPASFMATKKLAGREVDAGALADPATPLRSLL